MKAEDQRNQIYQKIGRNIILFQRLEHLLRRLIVHGNLRITFNNVNMQSISPDEQLKRQRETVKQKTLGCLKERFCKSVLSQNVNDTFPCEASKGEMTLAIKFFHEPCDYQNKLREDLNSVVDERNKTVHELITSFDTTNQDGINKLETYLNHQHQKFITLVEEIEALDRALTAGFKNSCGLLSTQIIENKWLNSFCVKEIVVYLQIYAFVLGKARPDGWASLAQAGEYLHQQCPEALKGCRNEYQTKLLNRIIVKTGIFELSNFPTGNGGNNFFYRMKQGCWIESDTGELNFCSSISLPDGTSAIGKHSLNMSCNF